MPTPPQPAKPHEDYPLTPHPCGQWCKKVRGKLRYFGVWSDPDAALRKYLDQKDDLLAGREPTNGNTAKIARPRKPYKGFPLTAHPSGQWCKKIRGTVRYFGVWNDPQAALNKYLGQKDELLAGREPTNGEGISVRELINHFLTAKQRRVDSRELTAASWSDYNATCRKVIEVFGKNRLVRTLRPIDFEELRASRGNTSTHFRL